MPRLALAICAIWFGSLFVFRSVVQLKRTGSTGMKGFHGRIGSLPWWAGVTASLGLVLAVLAPIAALLDGPGGSLWISSALLHGSGAACASIGIVGALVAQLSMGDSWRIGVDEAETTRLVTEGLYAWVRNPIFSFIGMTLVGLVLLVPNALAVAASLLSVLGIELQVRAVEEPHLRTVHGGAYRDYVSRVGRFVPGIGRMD